MSFDVLKAKEATLIKKSIQGKSIKLIPLDLELHIPILFRLSNGSPITIDDISIPEYDPDEVIWKYTLIFKFSSESSMLNFYQFHSNAPDCILFTIFDLELNLPVGVISYRYISLDHLTVEIGHLWVSPAVMRKGKSFEACYFLINNAFDNGFRCVLWKCTDINEGSKLLADKIGFRFEFQGENIAIKEDLVVGASFFSMTSEEWNRYVESGRYQRFKIDSI